MTELIPFEFHGGLSYLHKKLGGVEPLDFSEEAS